MKILAKISITVRGYTGGKFEIRTSYDGEVLCEIPVINSNVWETYSAPISIPHGVTPIYITYRGNGNASLLSFELS